jgi:hypothetical protein
LQNNIFCCRLSIRRRFEDRVVALDPATFSDTGTEDTYTAKIYWGDGSAVEAGLVGQAAGSGAVSGSHEYAGPGVYTVIVTIDDDDTASHSDTLSMIVVHGFLAYAHTSTTSSKSVKKHRLRAMPARKALWKLTSRPWSA